MQLSELLKEVIEERDPRVIGINRSTVFAFADGLTSGLVFLTADATMTEMPTR